MVNFFKKLFGNSSDNRQKIVTVVSGLPRSGTSMMMKMLEAGGISALTDEIRTADEDNPKGYYEFERVKKLDKGDIAWVEESVGKSVKVISALLKHLPPGYTYKVVFMRRKMEEILASQKQMLIRRGEPTDRVSDEELAKLLTQHLQHIQQWVDANANIDVLYVSYNDIMQNPIDPVKEINAFLGGTLNTEKMQAVVDPNLYRQKES